jgi:hypothetical protein
VKKRTGTLIVVVIVLAGLIGGYLYLTQRRSTPNRASQTALDLSKKDREKLVKIVLTDRIEGTLALEKKDNRWVVDSQRQFALNETNVDDLVDLFTNLSADRLIDDKPADTTPFGLKPPKARAEGTFSDGTVVSLAIGDKTPTGVSWYLQVKGDPKVYAVWQGPGERFHWTLKDIRDRKITPALNAEEMTYLRLSLRDGTVVEVREKTADEAKNLALGFGKYMLARPYSRPRGLDPEKLDPVIKGPAAVEIADFVDDDPKDLSKYGLERPWGEAVARDKSGSVDLLFGADTGKTRTYFMIRGRPGVYAVEKSQIFFMGVKPFDLIDKFAFITNIDDVDRIDLVSGGNTHTLAIARSTKKAEKQGEQDEIISTFTMDGKKAEEDSSRSFYQTIIGLQVEGEVRPRDLGKPQVTVKFSLNKGASRTVTVDYTPYDRDFYAVFVNGKGEFVISRNQVDAMLAKLEIFLKGGKVTN